MLAALSDAAVIRHNSILTLRPPPTSTLFPYTTLFRSQHTSASLTINENADPDVRRDFESHLNQMVPEDAPYYRHTTEGDRKSTRLNSSHGYISYAVFCLKKKSSKSKKGKQPPNILCQR